MAIQELGQCPFGGREFLLGVGDPGAGRCPGRVGDLTGVGADVHPIVGQRVDTVVFGGVFEHVLDPPPGPEPVQQPYRGGGRVAGQHLQYGRVVFVQGELAGGAVPLDLHHLVRK